MSNGKCRIHPTPFSEFQVSDTGPLFIWKWPRNIDFYFYPANGSLFCTNVGASVHSIPFHETVYISNLPLSLPFSPENKNRRVLIILYHMWVMPVISLRAKPQF